MKKHILTCLILGLGIIVTSTAQDRAPSLYLNYQDNYSGDIIINTLRAEAPSPLYTYYCSMLWNGGLEGAGYCGMQEHPNGRNFIFSIWDPISVNEPITTAYLGEGTVAENFGGEGTGLKSTNYLIGWETNQWYSFVSRVWNYDNHSYFGYWIYNHTDALWHHLITMDYPVPNVTFDTRTSSFIEDWLGNGWETRSIHHKDGWKRKLDDESWNPFSLTFFSRVFPDAGTVNYIENYDGGIDTDDNDEQYFFMRSGGVDLAPITTEAENYLSISPPVLPHPDFEVGEILSYFFQLNDNNLHLIWDIVQSKCPQFSYQIEIYDNQVGFGTPFLTQTDAIPQQREADIDISSLATDTYYAHLTIQDVLGRNSETLTVAFDVINTSIDEINPDDSGIILYPNPVTDKLYLEFSTSTEFLKAEVVSCDGKVVATQDFDSTQAFIDFTSLNAGIYFIQISDAQNRIIKYNKVYKLNATKK